MTVNDGEMMDQTKALVRYVCEVNGLKCENSLDNFKSEQLIEILTTDCKFSGPGGLFLETKEAKFAFYVDRTKKLIPGFLAKINKNCCDNIAKHGWAATDKMSAADVFLLAYISKNVFNPFRVEITEPMLKEVPVLHGYWESHKHLLKNYMENTRGKYII